MIYLLIDDPSLREISSHRTLSTQQWINLNGLFRRKGFKSFKVFLDDLPNGLEGSKSIGEIRIKSYGQLLRKYLTNYDVDMYYHPFSRQLALAGRLKLLLSTTDSKYNLFYRFIGDAIYDNHSNLVMATLVSNMQDNDPNLNLVIIKGAKHFFMLKHYIYRYNQPFHYFFDCENMGATEVLLRIANDGFSAVLSGLISQYRLNFEGRIIGDKINAKDSMDLFDVLNLDLCRGYFDETFKPESAIHIPQEISYYFEVIRDYWQPLVRWFLHRGIPVPPKNKAFDVFDDKLLEAEDLIEDLEI